MQNKRIQEVSIPAAVNESIKKTAIEEVYSILHSDILNGRLKPGSRLQIERLRQQYSVGSSTTREALSRLLADDFVTTEGQHGFRVAGVSLEDARQIYKLRAKLEAMAIQEAIKNGGDDWEGGLLSAHHRLAKVENAIEAGQDVRVAQWENQNNNFHTALYAACDNRWLIKFRSTLYNHSIRYLRITMKEQTVPRNVRKEHQAIFDAAMARDSTLAEALIQAHVRKSLESLEELFPET